MAQASVSWAALMKSSTLVWAPRATTLKPYCPRMRLTILVPMTWLSTPTVPVMTVGFFASISGLYFMASAS